MLLNDNVCLLTDNLFLTKNAKSDSRTSIYDKQIHLNTINEVADALSE